MDHKLQNNLTSSWKGKVYCGSSALMYNLHSASPNVAIPLKNDGLLCFSVDIAYLLPISLQYRKGNLVLIRSALFCHLYVFLTMHNLQVWNTSAHMNKTSQIQPGTILCHHVKWQPENTTFKWSIPLLLRAYSIASMARSIGRDP